MIRWLAANGVGAVRANIRYGNVASERVAGKLGLVPTAVIVDGERRWHGDTEGSGRASL